eukprot:XP_001698668.1 predicted protein [Chlamydomonas reinhardtii]
MSQPKLQYTSLLRGPILLAHFFATAFAIGYSVAGVRMSIFRIFAHGASPHRTCDAIMLGFMWYGGFTALAASGLTVVLVIVRCCLMSLWARAAGPGGAGVPRLKIIRSRYASARPAALVSLWLAPLAMLESLDEFRNGDGNDDTSSATAPAAGGAAAPQDRYRCFAAEAGLVLAPVWLHLFVVGSALGVLALLGARVMTDPFY